MNKKLICIIICTLLITTASLVVGGEDSNNKTVNVQKDENRKTINPLFWNYERPIISDFSLDYGTIPKLPLNNPPSSFDLRNVDGKNYITSIKAQSGGTCWAHAVIACMEGNLLMNMNWEKTGETDEPNLAEYHLDWWNGFNTFFNEDVPESNGLTPHHGAQCRIAAAYFARGEGAVYSDSANDDTELDDNWYRNAPNRFDENYHIYYPRHIENYDIGNNLQNIDLIKNKIMEYGPINIVFRIDYDFLDENYVHYQPASSQRSANHNVVLIGWDDNKIVQSAPDNGAWLCKNSWGSGWGLDGYFWISYYDKYCCHPYDGDEWTASFKQVEPLSYKRIYYHDFHGWQEDFDNSNEAFNVFTALDNEILSAVSFFTITNNVQYQVRIYDKYENGELTDELSSVSGTIDFRGFHTIDLDQPVQLTIDDEFYIYLYLSDGGIPYDQTTNVWGYTIESISHPGESYYFEDGEWQDLYEYENSANFCIKGLVSKTADLECNDNIKWRKVQPGSTITYNLSITNVGESFSKLKWEISEWPEWGTWSFSPNNDYLYPESGEEIIQISVVSPNEEDRFNGEIKIINKDNPNDYCNIPVSLFTPKNIISTHLSLHKFLEQHPHLFSLIRQILN